MTAAGTTAPARGRRFVLEQMAREAGWDGPTAADLAATVLARVAEGDDRPLNVVFGDVEADMMDATAP